LAYPTNTDLQAAARSTRSTGADLHPTPRARPAAATPHLIAQLNAEWATLQAEAPDWPTPWGETLGDVLNAIAPQADAVLGDLIRACQAGSNQAGRVVIQAFLGKIVLLSRSDSRLTADDLVAALWLRLARYPLERRPRRIAANLVLDARKDVLAEARTLVCLPAPEPADGLSAQLILETARYLGLAPSQNLAVTASVYADGLTSAGAAARHHLTPETVRWRCSDTVRRLRPYRDLLADACTTSHPTTLPWAA
jgi:DNA-directed RNA polymerase specialized sigma24 family protein